MKKSLVILMTIFTCLSLVGCGKKDNTKKEENNVIGKTEYNDYKISSNSVGDFDLVFLKNNTKNGEKNSNKVYSPLSIKFALEMLEEGSNGETKKQISNIIGDYNTRKYDNNSNMSFANALFIKDSYKDNIKSSYSNLISNKYNASIIYDTFTNADNINKWVSDKTFNLINNLIDDTTNINFVLINALAIDMEWIKEIQSKENSYHVDYYPNHIDFLTIVDQYENQEIENPDAEIDAVINKYDIVNTLGKENIKETVKKEYEKWLNDPSSDSCNGSMSEEKDVETYIKNTITDEYFNEMNEAYKDVQSSTDFEFYVDENVKVFAKDLKEYDGTTLQYVGIMPISKDLDEYINDVKASDINNLISNLKSIKLDNFKEGVITHITGYIPMFEFDYELDLINELKNLGVTDVFDSQKADLSNLTTDKQYISKAAHKSTIEFSNDGIKAAAVSYGGGSGAGDCGFNYYFKPVVEKIDLTFDKPYIFLIRDKNTGEVWFVGSNYTKLAVKPTYE